MAANNSIQLVIDLILKNKQELTNLLAQLKQQYGIEVDTSDLDAATDALANMSDSDTVIDADASGAVDAAEEATEAVESVPDEHETEITADGKDALTTVAQLSLAYQGLSAIYGKLSGAISETIELYSTQEQSDQRLLSALKDKTNAHAQYFNFLAQEADKIQQITLVGDEQSQKLMTAAANMGISLDQVADATKGAIGLSEKFKDVGLSQETAMKGIALAYQGEFTQLQRYIPELKSASTAAGKMAILQREMASGFNMATEAITTSTGKMVQLQNKYGDLKEKVGGWLMSAAVGWGQALGVLSDTDQKYAQMRTRLAGLQGDIAKMRALYDVYRVQEQTEETKLAMQVLREMAEEYERNKKAAEDAAAAAQAYNESVAHLVKPIADLSDEIDDILGDDKESTLLDDLFWSDNDLDTKIQGLVNATIEASDKNLHIINDFNQKTKQLNGDHYAASMMQIDEYYRQKHDALIEAGFTEEEITEQTEAAKDEIRKQYEQRALAGAGTMFGNMAKVAKAGGKKGFLAWKRFSQVQALIDTYKSATSAYAAMAGIPVVGPELGAIAAAAAIAAGMMNVRQIEKQKFAKGGIATEPSIFGEAGPEAAVPLPDGRSIPVTINQPVSSDGNDSAMLKQILNAIQALNANVVSGMNVTIHIHTTDRDLDVEVEGIDRARASMERRGYAGS